MEYVIYKLTAPNGKIYIGQTKNFNQRMIEHKSCKRVNKLYNSVRKYGWDNFEKEIIAKCDGKENANLIEESLIKEYKSSGRNGLNTVLGGGGGDLWRGRYDTEEYMKFVEKMTKINKGENNGMFGKKHSKSAIQKQKEKAKGRFSLPWYIDRHGIDEGTRLYEERRQWLKSRNLPTDEKGQFIKKNN